MGGSIGEHVWRQSYKMSTSQVTFGANLIKCQLLMSTSTVILARILQSVNFSIYRYILGNTNTGVCSDIGNTNTSIHPASYCPIWDEAVLIPSLSLTAVASCRSMPCSMSVLQSVPFQKDYFFCLFGKIWTKNPPLSGEIHTASCHFLGNFPTFSYTTPKSKCCCSIQQRKGPGQDQFQ